MNKTSTAMDSGAAGATRVEKRHATQAQKDALKSKSHSQSQASHSNRQG